MGEGWLNTALGAVVAIVSDGAGAIAGYHSHRHCSSRQRSMRVVAEAVDTGGLIALEDSSETLERHCLEGSHHIEGCDD